MAQRQLALQVSAMLAGTASQALVSLISMRQDLAITH